MRELVTDLLVFGGRFRLVRQIGEGGMGVVWEATEVASNHRFAIKFLRDAAASPELEKRFFREAEAANAVRHPCILHVHEIAHDEGGSPAFVMDLLEGESLSVRIEREGKLTIGQTAAILVPALQGLRAAHAGGVVHRDLKPDNIFVTREPRGGVGVRVLDFGIARLTRPSEKLTVTGTLMGTPLYMSPEQAAGESVDARTDVWSMAALTFECLTGMTPVSGENYGQILSRLIRRDVLTLGATAPDLPRDIVQAIDALFVERDRRAPDLGPLERALAPYADAAITEPPAHVPAPPSTRNYRADGETMLDASAAVRPPARAFPAVIVGLGLMLLVGVAAGTAAMLVRSKHASSTAVTREPPSITSAVPVAGEPSAPTIASVEPIASIVPVPIATPSASATVAATSKRLPPGKAAPSVVVPSVPPKLSGGVAGAPAF